MEIQVDVRKAVWTRYWANGVAHSCGGSYGNRYEGAIARFWRDAFATLAPGARVLDVATGNGAVPQLLLDSKGAAGVRCDAVDLASPQPQWIADLPPERQGQVRFHSQVAAESLPFADAAFDLVTSQYGLEYTELDRTVPEILRVLRPGGRVCLLTHHADARPVRLARAELAHLDWMYQPSGLLETASAMLEPMARAATEAGRASLANDAAANAVRDRFNRLQAEATHRAQHSECPDVLGETRSMLLRIFDQAGSQGAFVAGAALQQLCIDLADSEVRLEELCRYALDETEARHLCTRLASGADAIRLERIVDNGVLMGWGILIRPA